MCNVVIAGKLSSLRQTQKQTQKESKESGLIRNFVCVEAFIRFGLFDSSCGLKSGTSPHELHNQKTFSLFAGQFHPQNQLKLEYRF